MSHEALCPAVPLIAGLLLVAGLPPAAAQEPPPLFVERVDVNVVNVEVFVTDARGRQVAGLGREDFEVLQDGEPVEVTNFFSISRQDRVAEALSASPAELAAGAARGGAVDLPPEQQLNLLVYVDHFNLHPSTRSRVLDDLRGFLEDRMFEGDRVMVMGYDGQLDLVQPFTRDPVAVDAALAGMKKVKTGRQQFDARRNRVMAGIRIAFRDGEPVVANELVRGYIQEQQLELRRSAKALSTVVRSLAGLPGRKALVYVSEGLPQRPGEDLYQYMAEIFSQTEIPGGSGFSADNVDTSIEALKADESAVFDDITRHANAHQVTLYPVDARGAAGDSTLGADNPGLMIANRTGLDALRTVMQQEPLIEMAVATGGRAVLGTSNFADAMRTDAGDFDNFYSLGYASPAAGDGRYHVIEVRVKRPGLRVRHRQGYVDKPQAEIVADRTLSSLVYGLESNPLGVSIDFGTPERSGRRAVVVPVMVRIPFRDVTLLPNGALEEGRLHIFLAVQDDRGGVSDLHRQDYPLSIPHEQLGAARGKEIGYLVRLQVTPGTPTVAVGVWDELSGTESFVHKQLRVARPRS